MPGDNCSSACKTRDHATFGECMRAKSLRVAYCQSWKGLDATAQKKWDRDLAAYKGARSEGIQPATTKRHDVDNAVRISNEHGKAFQA